MDLVYKHQFSGFAVEATFSSVKEMIEQAAFFGSLPTECPVCGASVFFDYYVTKEKQFKYYGMRCTSLPAHQTQFGQNKNMVDVFYKGPDSWKEAHRHGGGERDEDEAPAMQMPPPRSEFNQPAPKAANGNENGAGKMTEQQETAIRNLAAAKKVDARAVIHQLFGDVRALDFNMAAQVITHLGKLPS
jgi:hypothetical protein